MPAHSNLSRTVSFYSALAGLAVASPAIGQTKQDSYSFAAVHSQQAALEHTPIAFRKPSKTLEGKEMGLMIQLVKTTSEIRNLSRPVRAGEEASQASLDEADRQRKELYSAVHKVIPELAKTPYSVSNYVQTLGYDLTAYYAQRGVFLEPTCSYTVEGKRIRVGGKTQIANSHISGDILFRAFKIENVTSMQPDGIQRRLPIVNLDRPLGLYGQSDPIATPIRARFGALVIENQRGAEILPSVAYDDKARDAALAFPMQGSLREQAEYVKGLQFIVEREEKAGRSLSNDNNLAFIILNFRLSNRMSTNRITMHDIQQSTGVHEGTHVVEGLDPASQNKLPPFDYSSPIAFQISMLVRSMNNESSAYLNELAYSKRAEPVVSNIFNLAWQGFSANQAYTLAGSTMANRLIKAVAVDPDRFGITFEADSGLSKVAQIIAKFDLVCDHPEARQEIALGIKREINEHPVQVQVTVGGKKNRVPTAPTPNVTENHDGKEPSVHAAPEERSGSQSTNSPLNLVVGGVATVTVLGGGLFLTKRRNSKK